MKRLTPYTGLQIIALKLKSSSPIGLLHVAPVHLHLILLNRELHSIPATHRKVSADIHTKAVPRAWQGFAIPHICFGGLSPGHSANKSKDTSPIILHTQHGAMERASKTGKWK